MLLYHNSGDDTRKNFSRARENSAKSADSRDDFGGFSADGGAQSVFAKFRFLYYIGLDGMRAGRIATSSHQQRKITTILPFRPPSGQTRHGAPHFVLSVFLPCEAPRNLV
jgi:hypothetical protein